MTAHRGVMISGLGKGRCDDDSCWCRTSVVKIEPGTCQAKIGEQSLEWRRAGLSKYSGPIDLCGDIASHMIDGVPMCGKHVHWHHKRAGEIANPHVLLEPK